MLPEVSGLKLTSINPLENVVSVSPLFQGLVGDWTSFRGYDERNWKVRGVLKKPSRVEADDSRLRSRRSFCGEESKMGK